MTRVYTRRRIDESYCCICGRQQRKQQLKRVSRDMRRARLLARCTHLGQRLSILELK